MTPPIICLARCFWGFTSKRKRSFNLFGVFNDLCITAVARGRYKFHKSWEDALHIDADPTQLAKAGLMSKRSAETYRGEFYDEGWAVYADPKGGSGLILSDAWRDEHIGDILNRQRAMKEADDAQGKIATRHNKETDPKSFLLTQSTSKGPIATPKPKPKGRMVRTIMAIIERLFGRAVHAKQARRAAAAARNRGLGRRPLAAFVKKLSLELIAREQYYPPHAALEIIIEELQGNDRVIGKLSHREATQGLRGDSKTWAMDLLDAGYPRRLEPHLWDKIYKTAVDYDSTFHDVRDQIQWLGKRYRYANRAAMCRYICDRIMADAPQHGERR